MAASSVGLLVHIECDVLEHGERTVLIRDRLTGRQARLSLVPIDIEPATEGKPAVVSIPEWLARREGLL